MKSTTADNAKKYPNDYNDLNSYRENWQSWGNHMDRKNTLISSNRHLLIGRPQLGKTGVYLHLSYLLWKECGSPEHTRPAHELETGEFEHLSDDEDEQKFTAGREKYPKFDKIKSLVLRKPPKSKFYGNPLDPEVRKFYEENLNYHPSAEFNQDGNGRFLQPEDKTTSKRL